ncbi:TauD/TfdA family dioxygenase [Litorimonas sp. RW-G-Af-16]|uniref:TauD/TfdA family dioxygenase n=1 Tax=Litorimonas sp. RW-G-Af-16 TaxID=3241168 RepID=UPI00390CA070
MSALATIDPDTGGLALSFSGQRQVLHPLWLRERVNGENVFDPISHQRLYEHSELPDDLVVSQINDTTADAIKLTFNSGETLSLSLQDTLQELGWAPHAEALPSPQSWDASLNRLPEADWADLDQPAKMKSLLEDYFRHGFCILQNTPTDRDSLKFLARRFGYLRETNFGELFNVEMKPNPSDLAYTDVALASHTDNPYRAPVPGIQYLHCLRNEVSGGLSTLVDGMAIAEALRREAPDQADVLERVSVRFRYEGPSAILEHFGPLIERDHVGIVRQIRLSSRLDYVPALDHDTLSLFYAGRKRLHVMSESDEFQIRFPFRPGTLLMMDNYRLLHGRTAFNGRQGHRHLQGCYIDHDGPASLYRMLVRDGVTTSVRRED